jgi:streptomycin 6-kinase
MLPKPVQNKARRLGADDWLRHLPALVTELERRWRINVGDPYEDATEAFVAAATTETGQPVVLKILIPREDIAVANEITVLRLAAGAGCARLLNADAACNALLLERLGPSLHDLALPIQRRHEILCDVAATLWRPAADAGLPTGAEKAEWLIDAITQLWLDLDRPCSERAVEHAVACAERRARAHDDERARLVHGDVHQWNTLQAGAGWKLIDPDGLLADPEYDLGIIMREDPEALLQGGAEDRARWLADRSGCDARAIWEWGTVERVSTGLLGTAIELQPVARAMLAAADYIAATDPDPF